MSINKSKVIRKPKLYVVCGPTATGKTNRAIEIAKELDGEVISADSRQVYRDMNIGTAKVTVDEMDGIPHHMIDIVDPGGNFSVAEYKKMAQEKITDIIARGKTPILCGGTGMYIDAVVYNRTLPEVPPDTKLRNELSQKTPAELFEILSDKDLNRAKNIDKNNPVRLIRAIEIVEALGRVPASENDPDSPYNVEWIYLDKQDDELQQRIHSRDIQRLSNGLIDEVKDLHEKGVSLQWLYDCGLEYRYVTLFLYPDADINIKPNERIPQTKEELITILDEKTWQFVTRQRTWFKKYSCLKNS